MGQCDPPSCRRKPPPPSPRRQRFSLGQVVWLRKNRTIGNYDIATIVEAPDVRPLTTLLLSVGQLGNVRTHTLRAFSASEMQAILGRVQ
jgi:uncharacterized protein with GYD domain